MKRHIFFVLLFTFFNLLTSARPVRVGNHTFHQPDGSSFQARCVGDEFYKIHLTNDGYAIVKGEDGWWYYADFEADGKRVLSGHKVGQDTPQSVLDRSRNIPYSQIEQAAYSKKNARPERQFKPQLLSEGKTTKRALVILAQYEDVSFEYGRDKFADMLTKDGYSYNGATGSAKEYFEDQFGGKVEFIFEVSPVVTLSQRRSYYGANDSYYEQDMRPAEMIKEACELADAQGVDFAKYDEDGDGYVDNVFVFFAGGDEAENPDETDYIWSHSWYVKSGAGLDVTLDGKKIDRYACSAELAFNGTRNVMTGIGTFCHEYSHTMDLPDLYDTDYEANGWGAGMWAWTSLMDGGNMNNDNNTPPYFNAIEREFLGIAQPTTIVRNGTYTLEPVHLNSRFYRIDTQNPGEYYLIECRKETGWDTFIKGSGMLVYHIDKSARYTKRWADNQINCYANYQCADVIEADNREDKFYSQYDYVNKVSNIKGIFFPNQSSPTVHLTAGVSMTNIKKDGDNITFSIVGFPEEETPPVATEIKVEAFMDAAIIQFESDREFDGDAIVNWGRTGQETTETIVYPYEDCKYSLTLTGLTPGNKTYSVSIHFCIDDVAGESTTTQFMTTKVAPVDWPYIFVGKNRANEDGTFTAGTRIALMAYNSSGAEEVEWTFNGKKIHPEDDGYYTLQESGTLKACIYWEDGSKDIIEKKINVTIEE